MPIRYEIDDAQGVVWTTASGVLTDEELIQHKQALVADPRFRPGMKEFSDVRGVDRLDVTPQGIARFIQFDQMHSEALNGHKLALVVPTDFVFGMGRMYQQRVDGEVSSVQVFRDQDEARAWLGLDEAE